MSSKLFLIALLLFTFILLLPQLQIPWMLLDDGESARTSTEISQHFQKGDFLWPLKLEAHNGYLRPTYWISHWIGFNLLGNDAFRHHLSQLGLYITISLLVFFLVKEISKDNLAGLLAGIFLLLFYPAGENLYRLGTNEPTLVLFLLGTLYFLIRAFKSNSWRFFGLSIIFLIIAWLNKPTTIILAPFSLFALLLFRYFSRSKEKKSIKFIFLFFLANLIFAIVFKLLFSFFMVEGGYGSQYLLNFKSITTNLLELLKLITKAYGPIVYLLLGVFAFRIYKNNKIESKELSWESKWELLMCVLFILFILIQAPWPYIMGRYLPPSLIGLAVVFGIELSFVFKLGLHKIRQNKKSQNNLFGYILSISALVLWLYFVISGTFAISKMYKEVIPGEGRRAVVVDYLAKVTPLNGKIYYNFSDGLVEFLYEMGLHFQFFQKRPDIKTDYLFLDNGTHFQAGDIIVTGPKYSQRYPWEQIKYTFGSIKDLQEIDQEWEIIQVTKDTDVAAGIFTQPPPKRKNLLKGKNFSYVDGNELTKISIKDLDLVSGGISFSWTTPKNITETDKKIALIHQGQDYAKSLNGISIFAGNNFLTFAMWDPWKMEQRLLTAEQVFLAETVYKVILKWGKVGMTLTVGSNHKFLPYYAGFTSNDDIIIGPLKDDAFLNESGVVNNFIIFTEI